MGSYTYSHNIDNVAESLTNAGGQELQDSYNLSRNRGNSTFDIRQAFVTSSIYELPFGRGKHWLNKTGPLDWVLGGWQAGGILTFRTGTPFTPLVSVDISNTGTSNPTGGVSNQNHPNRVGNGNLPSGREHRGWFDLSAFTVPGHFTRRKRRDILYGPAGAI